MPSGRRTYDLKRTYDVGMMKKADDIHAALSLNLEVTSSAWPHALMPHQGPFAEQLDSIQVHVCAIEDQLDFPKGTLAQGAHNDVLIHKSDALQHMSARF